MHMRRTRHWILAVLVLAVLIGGALAFYFTFVDTAYSRAEFYADTGLILVSAQADSTGLYAYGDKPGHVVLMLARGEPHGIVTYDHAWLETVSIEIPEPSAGERVSLGGANVQIAFGSTKLDQLARVGEGGIKGHLEIQSVGRDQIVASYDLVIDGVYPRFVPEHRHRDVVFRGRSTFRARPRPADQFAGELWPRMSPVTPSKK